MDQKQPDEEGLSLPPAASGDLSGVRCPECAWQPQLSDRWRCGCGHAWNVFEARGVCPLCGAKQAVTACLECKESSAHDDWYPGANAAGDEADDDDDEEDDEEAARREAAFMVPLTPSPQLARIVGAEPLPRVQIIKRVWEYIKKHGLQDKVDRRMINADAALREVFGADQVSMFAMTASINKHLS